ncbi:hypothetical protein DL98DRAFT_554046 [Cadophora sp. DSE1049]|nr:hypothetical protein DL98DRAFT_554046 [Cadophora sp. DSE1049]
MIILKNETLRSLSYEDNFFILKRNLLHTFSTKSKKVTRSVLVSEIYNIISGVNIAIAVNSFLATQIIVCTNSFSLYECFIKLGTIKKKRLIINIIALRQSENNLANAITKISPNPSLKTFLDKNQVIVRVQG